MPIKLVPPGSEVGFFGDAAIPADLYFLSHDPAPLIGMGFPSRIDWQQLFDAGVRHVVCLTHDNNVPYVSDPVITHAFGLQDLFCEPTGPLDHAAERVLVLRAAAVVSDAISNDEGVAVHCRGGRGRAGTVLGVALVNLGHRPRDVVEYLDRLHRTRGKGGWPESPWQATTVLNSQA